MAGKRQDGENERQQRMVSYLLDRLGTPLVSYIAVTNNKMDAWMWAEPGTRPTPAQTRRVRCAYDAWKIVQRWKSDEDTKAWFDVPNQQLGVAPTDAIRNDDVDLVIGAARATADNDLVVYARQADPVVIYDAMRGAANRCAAAFVARITQVPDDRAIDQVPAVWSFADGIDANDASAQLRATDLLHRLRERLAAGKEPDVSEVLSLPSAEKNRAISSGRVSACCELLGRAHLSIAARRPYSVSVSRSYLARISANVIGSDERPA